VTAEKTKILPTVPVMVERATVVPAKTTFGPPVGVTPKPEAATAMETWSKQAPLVKTALDQVGAAKAVIGDLAQNKTDIIIMPVNEIYIAKQKALGKAVSDKLSKDYGQNTLSYAYKFTEGRMQDLLGKKGVLERAVEEFRRRKAEEDPRIIVYVPDVSVDEVRNVVNRDYTELAGSISIIGETVPDNVLIDEVMHIVLGKGLLNYQRYQNTLESPEVEERLLNFIRMLVANPGEITPDVLKDFLHNRMMLLKIKPVNFEDIEKWKRAQDQMLRSL
jgi:hypothetical protein